MVVTGVHWFFGGEVDCSNGGGDGRGWSVIVKEGVEKEDSRSWGNCGRYKVS